MSPDELLVPPATRLVHIGPHKTGTTSLQHAMHTKRESLRHNGVHYTGPSAQPVLATLAVAGGPGRKGERAPRPEDWTEITDEIRDAGEQRVVLSSEFLCHADDEAARRVVREVTGGPVHVVVTLRPIAKIVPSQWQQFVQNGRLTSYEDWLTELFPPPGEESTEELFWHRHSHGEQVQRWARAVGPENLTVVVADDADPGMLARTFEAMLGLPDRLLEVSDVPNRSMTLPETQMVRLINRQFCDHDWDGAWSGKVHGTVIREGALKQMKAGRAPAPGEARVATPGWALERAAEKGARDVELIEACGVRVVGDISTLAEVPTSEPDGSQVATRPNRIRADAVGLAVFGVLTGRGPETRENRAAAVLTTVGALAACDGEVDPTGMPLMAVEIGARAVVGAIEGLQRRSEFAGLPSLPTGLAGSALYAAVHAVGASSVDPEAAGHVDVVADALGLAGDGMTRSGVPPLERKRAGGAPARNWRAVELLSVQDVTSKDLLDVVARRGARRLRRRLRR